MGLSILATGCDTKIKKWLVDASPISQLDGPNGVEPYCRAKRDLNDAAGQDLSAVRWKQEGASATSFPGDAHLARESISNGTLLFSDEISGPSSSGWELSWSNSQLSQADCSDADCETEWQVRVSRPQSSSFNCDELDDSIIVWDFLDKRSKPNKSAASQCSAGSGSFRLLPQAGLDEDLDGTGWKAFLPVRTSGTGKLTGDAQIDSLTVVNDDGEPVSGGGRYVNFAKGPFAIEAVLSNMDPGVGADLELIDLRWYGVSVCPSGTYQLDAE